MCIRDRSNMSKEKQWEDMEMTSPLYDSETSCKGGDKCKGVCLLMSLCVFWILLSIRTVSPAHAGIATTFGSPSKTPLGSGIHFVNPMATVTQLNLKTQLLFSENHVPTQEGLNVQLDVSLLYRVDAEKVLDLFLGLGVDYEKTVILPELQSAVRGLTSEVSAKALYTSGRLEIREKLKAELLLALAPRGIVLEDVLLKGIKLPQQLIDAIELKAQAEQESARMEFVVSKEKMEAERKKVEASGIAAFQRIVSEGISTQLLQWKGIEATENLAKSPNAKIVMMGNTKDSLPVLLSSDISAHSDPEHDVVPLAKVPGPASADYVPTESPSTAAIGGR
eukprot:TRINITY_DN26326_c0_g1_i1.p1 TRINITY_DN26326_c0_g1~~TRINITY_DN26326_c0_g1_i1.p1  ORF type:complete len:336 (-),score=116.06 TRINITY_DN26326_c0_g1_i1:202-1209(-)